MSQITADTSNRVDIEVFEKYFLVTDLSNFVEVVRRDSKFTSGYMSKDQVSRIIEIEARLEANKTTYINIDTNVDPDCFWKSTQFAVYLLHQPSDKAWSLLWCDDENIDNYEELEELLIEVFEAEREMDGCFSSNNPLPQDYEARCKAKNIVINKIGERLEEC